jgi:hypothetical protein
VAIRQMKITKGKIFKVILLLLVGFLAYQFIYGRLIMFSPIVVGFEKQKAENSIVYYHENNTRVDNKTLDSLILKTEQFHKLEFNQKIRIFFCTTDKEFKRYTGSSARMVTIFGNSIFVSGTATEERKTNKISFDTYLLHELSHLLIYQNMTFGKAMNYPQWFLEGVAVFSSNQFGKDGYLTVQGVSKEIKKGNFVQPKDWGTAFSSKGKTVKDCKVLYKYRFIYAEFGSIIKDLIDTYGQEIFLNLLHQSLKSNDFYTVFKKNYGIEFSEYITEFERRIKATNNVYKK